MKRFFFIVFILVVTRVKSSFFIDVSDDVYDMYTLTFENLSTDNFLDYFSDLRVINIYPYVNPVYKKSVGDLSYHIDGNLVDSISDFKNKYLDIIKKNSYLDYSYLYLNGINISKMDVYLSHKELYDIFNCGLLVHVVK